MLTTCSTVQTRVTTFEQRTHRLGAGSSSAEFGFPPRSQRASSPPPPAAPEPRPRGGETGRPSRSPGTSGPWSSSKKIRANAGTDYAALFFFYYAALPVKSHALMTSDQRRCGVQAQCNLSELCVCNIYHFIILLYWYCYIKVAHL